MSMNFLRNLGKDSTKLAKIFFIGIVKFYRFFISPWFLPSCRFQPTCSEYAKQAFEKKKVTEALYLVIKRLLKCHPFGGYGFDPLPLDKTVEDSLKINKSLL